MEIVSSVIRNTCLNGWKKRTLTVMVGPNVSGGWFVYGESRVLRCGVCPRELWLRLPRSRYRRGANGRVIACHELFVPDVDEQDLPDDVGDVLRNYYA